MSFLKVNKVLITRDSKTVYSESFRNGVNIIRGDNSTGKSTISNFIFYALGGEFNDWLPEAGSCSSVYIEIKINGAILTLKRDIESSPMRSMNIFIGELDRAIESNYEGWKNFAYKKTDNVESFSQILFKALDFPEISTENQETITINQILRLIYINQLGSLDSLMKNEDYDSPLVRSAIGNLLIGTYNDRLLRTQMLLRDKVKAHREIKKQVKAIEDVLKNSPFESDSESLTLQIQEKVFQLQKTSDNLNNFDNILSKVKNSDTKDELKKYRKELRTSKDRYAETDAKLIKTRVSVIDSNEFIAELDNKLHAIKSSLNASEALGSLPIQYCPICLEKIDTSDSKNCCCLCKHEITEDKERSKLLRMQLEIQMQVKESKAILEKSNEEVRELNKSLRRLGIQVRNAQNDFDVFVNKTSRSVDNKLDKLYEQRGTLKSEIIHLNKQQELLDSCGEYKGQMFALKSAIDRLAEEVETESRLQKSKTRNAYLKIQEYTLELLKGDGVYEEYFVNSTSLNIDFAKNAFYLNDRNQFSASSMVILKNSVRFAIFFASIELDYFRYPRFILCDNIEDKGMKRPRSMNFQRNLIRLAESPQFRDKNFQLIFSTSMIAEELNIDKYTVGCDYNSTNKALKF